MPTYISSKGQEKDTGEMPTTYIRNALRKAQEEGNDANILALQTELATRDVSSPTDDADQQQS